MEEKSNRADLLDSYTKIIHPTKYQPNRKSKKIEIDICKLCDVEMNLIQSEGLVVCPQCGREEHILIDSDKPSYKDPPPEAGEFTYKRINRFDEWLTQYQAKETTEIPQEVLDSILLEMKKEGITNLCRLTMEKVRGYLKKLSLNKYYEHIPHIIYCLNGLPTPRLTQETEEKLRSMFRQIQDIFDIVCPDDRTNFLSYSYLLTFKFSFSLDSIITSIIFNNFCACSKSEISIKFLAFQSSLAEIASPNCLVKISRTAIKFSGCVKIM